MCSLFFLFTVYEVLVIKYRFFVFEFFVGARKYDHECKATGNAPINNVIGILIFVVVVAVAINSIFFQFSSIFFSLR